MATSSLPTPQTVQPAEDRVGAPSEKTQLQVVADGESCCGGGCCS